MNLSIISWMAILPSNFCLQVGTQAQVRVRPFRVASETNTVVVSRTCTAPFDRLKIFLITRPPELGGPLLTNQQHTGVKVITNAIARIYAEGGLLAFWTGNGLSVAKIFPESAIKFFSY